MKFSVYRPRSSALLASAVLTLFLLATKAFAVDPVNTNEGKYAIGGMDPVAYFTVGEARAGAEAYGYLWNGATWLFSSAENRALFIADPEKYAPQYGGYCAWAVAQGNTARIDPDSWEIVDGKLYLNYNKSVQHRWQANARELIGKADKNWPAIVAQ